jgi:hypothetical protein
MKFSAKQLTAYAIAALIIAVSVIALLSIWDIISLENVMAKIIKSLAVLFVASVVSLFIFNVLIKEK